MVVTHNEGDDVGRWTPALITGNDVIDREHRELIRLIDTLELEGAGLRGDGVRDALDQLTDYVFVHFQMEEKLMRREEYPVDLFEEHAAQHRDLEAQTRVLVDRYEAGELTTVEPIVEVLYAWFANHIARVDTKMAEYVRRRHGATA